MNYKIVICFHLISILSFAAYALGDIEVKSGLYINFLIIAYLLINVKKFRLLNVNFKLIDTVVLIYMFFNIFTILNVILIGNSIEVYLKAVSSVVVPMTGYFLFSYANLGYFKTKANIFFETLLIANVFSLIVGFLLYFTRYEFYTKYISKMLEGNVSENDPIWIIRLISYFGDSALIGNISAVSFVILLYFINSNYKYFKIKLIYFSFGFALICGSILSFARSSWISLAVVYFVYVLSSSNTSKIKNIIFCIVILIFFIIIEYLGIMPEEFFQFILSRFDSFGKAYSERSDQIDYAIKLLKEYPLGFGLGQTGHKSIVHAGGNVMGLADNNYFRILTELGILGFFMFIFINILALNQMLYNVINSLHYRKIIFVCAGIIFIYLFQAIGTNVFDIYYSSFVYWSVIGLISLSTKQRILLLSEKNHKFQNQ
jgi:hypothetical protein